MNKEISMLNYTLRPQGRMIKDISKDGSAGCDLALVRCDGNSDEILITFGPSALWKTINAAIDWGSELLGFDLRARVAELEAENRRLEGEKRYFIGEREISYEEDLRGVCELRWFWCDYGVTIYTHNVRFYGDKARLGFFEKYPDAEGIRVKWNQRDLTTGGLSECYTYYPLPIAEPEDSSVPA